MGFANSKSVSVEVFGLCLVANSLAVFFNNIPRPKAVAYEYAEMENSCHFGWFFKESNIIGFLLGLQTGTVLLRAPQNVKKIRLVGRIISRWDNKYIVTRNQSFTLDVPPSGQSALDFRGDSGSHGLSPDDRACEGCRNPPYHM